MTSYSPLFHFFKRSRADTLRTVDFFNKTSIEQLDMNAGISFAVHGFTGSYEDDYMTELLNILTDYGDNACCVDWSQWSNCFYFESANKFVYRVGELLAQVIELLRKDYLMFIKLLFGHSLGAHVIGDCGRRLRDPVGICVGKWQFCMFPYKTNVC